MLARSLAVLAAIVAASPAQDGGNPPAAPGRGALPESTFEPFTKSVVFVNVPGHPTNAVPGTGGLSFGTGGVTNSACSRPFVSSDGAHWAIEVRIDSDSSADDEA